jgi:hypothetical protein
MAAVQEQPPSASKNAEQHIAATQKEKDLDLIKSMQPAMFYGVMMVAYITIVSLVNEKEIHGDLLSRLFEEDWVDITDDEDHPTTPKECGDYYELVSVCPRQPCCRRVFRKQADFQMQNYIYWHARHYKSIVGRSASAIEHLACLDYLMYPYADHKSTKFDVDPYTYADKTHTFETKSGIKEYAVTLESEFKELYVLYEGDVGYIDVEFLFQGMRSLCRIPGNEADLETRKDVLALLDWAILVSSHDFSHKTRYAAALNFRGWLITTETARVYGLGPREAEKKSESVDRSENESESGSEDGSEDTSEDDTEEDEGESFEEDDDTEETGDDQEEDDSPDF